MAVNTGDMTSVRKAARENEIKRDNYRRLLCAECDERLVRRQTPNMLGTIRRCPDCGREWQKL
jgi:predicted RNA-binding Zn-ribbon protein involved in translation (DUF1610 family)